MGCCGQAYTEETIQGHKVPKAVYGVNIFNKIEDAEEHTSLKAMIADILNHMEQLFDYIKAKNLGIPLPFNDQPHIECFAIPFWKELEAARFWLEDASLQAKNCTQKECTGSHKDILNCG
jgi:hypothetical protein